MASPYRTEGPAVVSFSGGRTSGMMVHRIVEAHGGRLPDDVHVAFANTGKERPETLEFVRRCEDLWGVPVNWLEWRATPEKARNVRALAEWLAVNDPEGRLVDPAGFGVVGSNSVSREGEPFAALIAMKQRLPNWRERWCTEFLKVGVLQAFAEAMGLRPGMYTEVIGLRKDEPVRIMRAWENAHFVWDRRTKSQVPRVPARVLAHPLATAGVVKADVRAFWRTQPFDLELEDHEGNCDFCFMKARAAKKRIIRDHPNVPVWWNGQEVQRGQFWDRRDLVAGLIEEVRRSPEFGDVFDPEDEHDVECGLVCGGGR